MRKNLIFTIIAFIFCSFSLKAITGWQEKIYDLAEEGSSRVKLLSSGNYFYIGNSGNNFLESYQMDNSGAYLDGGAYISSYNILEHSVSEFDPANIVITGSANSSGSSLYHLWIQNVNPTMHVPVSGSSKPNYSINNQYQFGYVNSNSNVPYYSEAYNTGTYPSIIYSTAGNGNLGGLSTDQNLYFLNFDPVAMTTFYDQILTGFDFYLQKVVPDGTGGYYYVGSRYISVGVSHWDGVIVYYKAGTTPVLYEYTKGVTDIKFKGADYKGSKLVVAGSYSDPSVNSGKPSILVLEKTVAGSSIQTYGSDMQATAVKFVGGAGDYIVAGYGNFANGSLTNQDGIAFRITSGVSPIVWSDRYGNIGATDWFYDIDASASGLTVLSGKTKFTSSTNYSVGIDPSTGNSSCNYTAISLSGSALTTINYNSNLTVSSGSGLIYTGLNEFVGHNVNDFTESGLCCSVTVSSPFDICTGSSATFSYNLPPHAADMSSLTWVLDQNGSYVTSYTPTPTRSNNFTHVFNEPTISGMSTYSLTLIFTDINGCQCTTTVNPLVNATPSADFTPDENSVCTGFTGTGPVGNNSGFWEFVWNNASNYSTASGTSTPSWPPGWTTAGSGDYSINLTVTSAGCHSSTEKKYHIYSLSANFTLCGTSFSGTMVACLGSNSTLNYSPASGSSSADVGNYYWTYQSTVTGSTPVFFSSNENPALPNLPVGTYNITLKVTSNHNTSCTISQTYIVQVVAPPTADFTYSSTTAAVFQFTPSQSSSGYSFNWSFTDPSGTSTTYNPAQTFSTSGTPDACLTVSSSTSSGCPACTAKVCKCIVYAHFTHTPICLGSSVNFSFQYSFADELFWYVDGILLNTVSNPNTATSFTQGITFNNPGHHTVKLVAMKMCDNGYQYDTFYEDINIDPKPKAEISFTTTKATVGSTTPGPTTLNSVYTNSSWTYSWQIDGSAAGTTVSITPSPHLAAGPHTVILTITNNTVVGGVTVCTETSITTRQICIDDPTHTLDCCACHDISGH